MHDSLGLIGISWRHADAQTLARFTLPREDRAGRLRQLADALEVDELLYVATCNRVELAFVGGAAIGVAERRRRLLRYFAADVADRALRAWDGEGAVEHLYLVASGLDSARAGESEIAGQMKLAAAECAEAGVLGDALGALLREALQVAKRVRPVTEGHIGRASLADIAVEMVLRRLAVQPGSVALVGVSPMIAHCAATFAAREVPLLLVNRTLARAEAIAPAGARVRSLEAFRLSPDVVSAVVLATSAAEPLFSAADCQRLAARGAGGIPPLVVDLSVPASLPAAEAEAVGMEHVGMEQVTRAAEGQRELALDALSGARAIVDAALDARRSRAWSAAVDPTIVALRRRYAERAEAEVERALRAELQSLDAAQREALRRWAETLSQQLAHVPSRGLRDLSVAAGPDAAASFLESAAPDLAKDLRARLRA